MRTQKKRSLPSQQYEPLLRNHEMSPVVLEESTSNGVVAHDSNSAKLEALQSIFPSLARDQLLEWLAHNDEDLPKTIHHALDVRQLEDDRRVAQELQESLNLP